MYVFQKAVNSQLKYAKRRNYLFLYD